LTTEGGQRLTCSALDAAGDLLTRLALIEGRGARRRR
jgi:hypothetical protein